MCHLVGLQSKQLLYRACASLGLPVITSCTESFTTLLSYRGSTMCCHACQLDTAAANHLPAEHAGHHRISNTDVQSNETWVCNAAALCLQTDGVHVHGCRELVPLS